MKCYKDGVFDLEETDSRLLTKPQAKKILKNLRYAREKDLDIDEIINFRIEKEVKKEAKKTKKAE